MLTKEMADTLNELSQHLGPNTSLRFQVPGVFGAPALTDPSPLRLGIPTATMPKETQGTPFDTLGWDTIFAVPASKVNACFAQPNAYPTAFQAEMKGTLANVTLGGNFGAWAIAPGGSGSLINLDVPVSTGTAKITTLNGSTDYPLAGGSLRIQITLTYLSQTVTPWTQAIQSASRTNKVTRVTLSAAPPEPLAVGQVIVQSGMTPAGATTFNGQVTLTKAVDTTSYEYADSQADDTATGGSANLPSSVQNLYLNKKPPPNIPAVIVVTTTAPKINDPEILTVIGAAFGQYFNSNLDRINAVFNSVNVNMQADKADFQWLMPTSVGYAYQDSGSNDIQDAIFATLAMVNNNNGSGNVLEVAPGAIPQSAQAGLSIGTRALMTNIVMPSLPLAIGKPVDASYFQLGQDNQSVVNTKNVPMAAVKVGAINYYPEITTLKITISENVVEVYTLTHVNISAGIDTFAECTSYMMISLKPGTQTLQFTKAKEPLKHHWNEIATWIHVVEGILILIGLILIAIAGFVLSVPAAIVAGIIIGLIVGLAALTPEMIGWVAGDGSAEKIGNLVDMITMSTAAYAWPGAQEFTITSAGINGVLQLGGTAYPT